jgi:ubiquinone/menaquinone biosynthesis C-methylase UbiE
VAATRRDLRWIAEEFDRRAPTYDGSRMHRWQAGHAAQLLDPQPGQRVLDIATGTGLAIRAATGRTEALTYFVGVDVSEQMLRVALQHTNSEHQTFLRADAHHLPFKEAVFDAILCVAAVPYLQNLTQAAAEWRRVGRAGGVVVFTTPAAGGLVHRLLTMAAAEHNITVADPHAAWGSEPALRERAQELGLTVEIIVEHSLREPLHGTPKDAFNTVIDYGFAGSLPDLPDQIRDQIFATYERAHLEAQQTRQGSQHWLFTRCRLP